MASRVLSLLLGAALLSHVGLPLCAAAQAAETIPHTQVVTTHYRTATVEGIEIILSRSRSRGRASCFVAARVSPPRRTCSAISSQLSADRYHIIAPDYPGYGQSAMPDHTQFSYTFAHFATIVDGLMGQLGASRYAMYVMDYGAPVGFRLALKHPDRVTALIIQNGNAYDEGLRAFWDPIKAYWAENTPDRRAALDGLMQPATTKFQYTDGVEDLTRIDPDNWLHDQALLDRPGNLDIQLDLFRDYGTNVALYPDFQAFLRARHPPTLIVWGANDKIFPSQGATPFKRDLPDAELHLLDTGPLRARGQARCHGPADP